MKTQENKRLEGLVQKSLTRKSLEKLDSKLDKMEYNLSKSLSGWRYTSFYDNLSGMSCMFALQGMVVSGFWGLAEALKEPQINRAGMTLLTTSLLSLGTFGISATEAIDSSTPLKNAIVTFPIVPFWGALAYVGGYCLGKGLEYIR